MNAQVLSHFPMPWLTCIALVLFLSVFISAVVRTFARSKGELYGRIGALPLSEEGERHE